MSRRWEARSGPSRIEQLPWRPVEQWWAVSEPEHIGDSWTHRGCDGVFRGGWSRNSNLQVLSKSRHSVDMHMLSLSRPWKCCYCTNSFGCFQKTGATSGGGERSLFGKKSVLGSKLTNLSDFSEVTATLIHSLAQLWGAPGLCIHCYRYSLAVWVAHGTH